MFGVVPRVIWERVCLPDELNRIRLNMNCLFVETPREKILIETGIGEKWTAKQQSMYGIDRVRPLSETLFARTGASADEITVFKSVGTALEDLAAAMLVWRTMGVAS